MRRAALLPMATVPKDKNERPREWRRRVMLPARMRSPMGWGDVSILNVSSRGLMIHASLATAPGDLIEIRKGDQVVVARVVWRAGPRSGLRSDSVLPVLDLLAQEAVGDPADTAPPDRRREKRLDTAADQERSRLEARLFEFAGIAAIALSLSATVAALAGEVLVAPMRSISAVLG